MKGTLILEDGTILEGLSFGAETTTIGEIVFNTGMTGYQEILTDPSYASQVVTMTYPLIGNYGVNKEDNESDSIKVAGFIVKEYSKKPNHWQSTNTLDSYLKENNIPGIYGIDTRMLTKKIRTKGAMKCMITTETLTPEHKKKLEDFVFPKDIVKQVSSKKVIVHEGNGKRIGILDLGLKKGIVKQLLNLDCSVTIFPCHTKKEDILAYNLDALLLSNGPGDPKDAVEAIQLVKELKGQLPLFGICLGHQILALALGADTYKLKFGHRGANHPVIECRTGKVYMSSQNHGYAVKKTTIPNNVKISFLNVNDDTVEGIEHMEEEIKSVQFHPEEGPGPEDGHYIFKRWIEQL